MLEGPFVDSLGHLGVTITLEHILLLCLNTVCINSHSYMVYVHLLNVYYFAGPPSAPLELKVCPQALTSVVLSWLAPSDSLCIFSYIITIINIYDEGNISYTYNTTFNTTSITLFNMTQKLDYVFTVAGVDSGGRIGKSIAFSEVITLDGKLKIKKSII